ncbi:MAG: YdcF family protein, partial [Bacteroidota bacterium]
MSWWEPKPIEMSKLQNHEVVVVLGGGIANELKWPYDRGHFDPSADRLLQAFQLYKAGKIHKILVSAGTSSANKSRTEASISREFLISTGVPESDILIDIQSKNTFENALFSKTILKANRLEYSKILLITSAY